MSTVNDCVVLNLPKYSFKQGNLSPVYSNQHVPFEIKRVYYVYDIPGGQYRGGHAHKECAEFIIAVMGSFDVLLDDGGAKKTVTLNRAYFGLYVPRLVWRELSNFSSGAVCLVLASLPFEEHDYIRDYQEFIHQEHTSPDKT